MSDHIDLDSVVDEFGLGLVHEPRDFSRMSAEQVELVRARAREALERKRSALLLASLEGYRDAHRGVAHKVFGAKQQVLDGLIAEATGEDGVFDTSRLDTPRLKTLMQLLERFEGRGFGSVTQRVESTQQIDIRKAVVDLTKRLSGG